MNRSIIMIRTGGASTTSKVPISPWHAQQKIQNNYVIARCETMLTEESIERTGSHELQGNFVRICTGCFKSLC